MGDGLRKLRPVIIGAALNLGEAGDLLATIGIGTELFQEEIEISTLGLQAVVPAVASLATEPQVGDVLHSDGPVWQQTTAAVPATVEFAFLPQSASIPFGIISLRLAERKKSHKHNG